MAVSQGRAMFDTWMPSEISPKKWAASPSLQADSYYSGPFSICSVVVWGFKSGRNSLAYTNQAEASVVSDD